MSSFLLQATHSRTEAAQTILASPGGECSGWFFDKVGLAGDFTAPAGPRPAERGAARSTIGSSAAGHAGHGRRAGPSGRAGAAPVHGGRGAAGANAIADLGIGSRIQVPGGLSRRACIVVPAANRAGGNGASGLRRACLRSRGRAGRRDRRRKCFAGVVTGWEGAGAFGIGASVAGLGFEARIGGTTGLITELLVGRGAGPGLRHRAGASRLAGGRAAGSGRPGGPGRARRPSRARRTGGSGRARRARRSGHAGRRAGRPGRTGRASVASATAGGKDQLRQQGRGSKTGQNSVSHRSSSLWLIRCEKLESWVSRPGGNGSPNGPAVSAAGHARHGRRTGPCRGAGAAPVLGGGAGTDAIANFGRTGRVEIAGGLGRHTGIVIPAANYARSDGTGRNGGPRLGRGRGAGCGDRRRKRVRRVVARRERTSTLDVEGAGASLRLIAGIRWTAGQVAELGVGRRAGATLLDGHSRRSDGATGW